MKYPYSAVINVYNIWGYKEVPITLYSGITTFVGPNGSGKTQTLKSLRDFLKQEIGSQKVRYLTSNRIGMMEEYRSQTACYNPDLDQFNLGNLYIKNARHNIETSTGDFFTMDERKDVYIKVAERLSVLFHRQIFLRWDAGKLKVFMGKTGHQEEYSVAAEASGLVNIISILAALFDDAVEVLLIDEPEVSLHPQLQSYLLREIRTAVQKYNKTVIVSTHSPEFISLSNATDLCNYVFFRENGDLPIQVPPDASELRNRKLPDFLLRMGLIYKEAFFAQKVLLIEGSSDLILCRYLSSRFQLNLDVAGSQIIPVEGKGQFPVVAKLFRMIGKEVGVLTDLDGFTDDNSVIDLFSNLPQAGTIAAAKGHGDFHEMIRGINTTLSNLIRDHADNMCDIYQDHPYWINRDPDADQSKIIRRSLVAKLLTENNDALGKWPAPDEWKNLKTRLTVLLDCLEMLGCFVLRKGAVESYYLHERNDTFDGKPATAAQEISGLESDESSILEEQYDDLIRALRFAALDKVVDESFAVQKELLSELALILGVLTEDTSESELLSEIKRAKGSNDSLFNYQVIHDDGRLGVEVSLKSSIINVTSFPFEIFKGDNVNTTVERCVKFQ